MVIFVSVFAHTLRARDGWKAPEYELNPENLSQASDVNTKLSAYADVIFQQDIAFIQVFSLGIVFAYLLSNGQHPFGAVHLQQSK